MVNEAPQAPAAPEAVKNCAGCNKPMRKTRRYYRDGKYYCNKRCWKIKNKSPQDAEDSKEATPEATKETVTEKKG